MRFKIKKDLQTAVISGKFLAALLYTLYSHQNNQVKKNSEQLSYYTKTYNFFKTELYKDCSGKSVFDSKTTCDGENKRAVKIWDATPQKGRLSSNRHFFHQSK